MVWVLVIGAVILAALVVVFGRRKSAAPKAAKRARGRNASSAGATATSDTASTRKPKGPYAAVAIRPGKNACARSHERSNIRYLESAAPTLPVHGCDSGNCQCGFVHYADRRSEADGDRRMGGLQSTLHGAASETGERRHRRGRRINDH